MILTLDTARQRVARGAHHLDMLHPGWADRIDIGRLELSCQGNCILGQIHGSYFEAVAKYYPVSCEYSLRETDLVIAYGFAVASLDVTNGFEYPAAYRLLQDAWIGAIAARKTALRSGPVELLSPNDDLKQVKDWVGR